MLRLPIPLPEDPDLAEFVVARYEASSEERAEMEPPPLARSRDGLMTALHFFYQNNPFVFASGCLLTAGAIVRIVWRAVA